MSRDLRVGDFTALPVGRCGDAGSVRSQFGVCHVNRRMVEGERSYRIIAVKDRDNATFQDKFMPSIRRDYADLLPRQIVVGDVHPVDIMMRRPDGTVVYPKAIAWYDIATNEMHMTFVLLEPKEGIRREHVAQSFQAMVEEWGLPQMLYLDNGSEYSWDAMIDGFTQLSKLTNNSVKVFDLDGNPDVAARVAQGREAIIRSRPYNAKGKPGIEGAFGNLEQVFFATIQGWTAGDRMNKKTHAKGRDPVAFPGDAQAFLEKTGRALEWYHKRPQYGRLAGRSPNEVLRGFIEGGWGKTTTSRPEVLALAFAEVVERVPDRGRVSYTPRRGETLYFYDDALLGFDRRITLRVATCDLKGTASPPYHFRCRTITVAWFGPAQGNAIADLRQRVTDREPAREGDLALVRDRAARAGFMSERTARAKFTRHRANIPTRRLREYEADARALIADPAAQVLVSARVPNRNSTDAPGDVALHAVFARPQASRTHNEPGYLVTVVDLEENTILSHHWREGISSNMDITAAQPVTKRKGFFAWLTS